MLLSLPVFLYLQLMDAAIDFHHQPAGRTIKINDVCFDGMLPPELESTELAITQPLPQAVLRMSHLYP